MDIKLKRDVNPHITPDTTFDELVELAGKSDAIAHSTGLYGTRNQHTNAVSNAVTQPRPKDTRNNTQRHHNDPPTIPPSTMKYHPMRKKDAKEKEYVTIVER